MNKDRLEEINQSLLNKFELLVLDGITDYESYKKADKKILWIMKEANQSGGQHTDDLRDFHKNVMRYKNWRRTYKSIIKTTYGILDDLDYNEIPREDQIVDVLRKIAFINVKKTGGDSSSHFRVINDHYIENKELIMEQVKCIEPDIIINCSRIWQVFADLATSDFLIVDRFNVAKANDSVIINAFHPNQRFINQIQYYNSIRQCLNKMGQ